MDIKVKLSSGEWVDVEMRLLEYGEEVIAMTDAMLKKVSEDERLREWHRARELIYWMNGRSFTG